MLTGVGKSSVSGDVIGQQTSDEYLNFAGAGLHSFYELQVLKNWSSRQHDLVRPQSPFELWQIDGT